MGAGTEDGKCILISRFISHILDQEPVTGDQCRCGHSFYLQEFFKNAFQHGFGSGPDREDFSGSSASWLLRKLFEFTRWQGLCFLICSLVVCRLHESCQSIAIDNEDNGAGISRARQAKVPGRSYGWLRITARMMKYCLRLQIQNSPDHAAFPALLPVSKKFDWTGNQKIKYLSV